MACEISQAAAIFIERVTTTVDLDQHLSEINSILTVAAGSSGTAVNIISYERRHLGKLVTSLPPVGLLLWRVVLC